MSTKAEKGQSISPALDPAATIVTMKEAVKILRTSKITLYGYLRDGLLQSFRVGARRYCTLAQIQDCVRELARRGAEKKFKPNPNLQRERRASAR
jgi:hypothetical protein